MKIRTIVISCAISLVASQAHAQTFQRTPDGRYVEYSQGDFLVRFDSQFGGAPTEWFYKGRLTSSPHPGEAVNLTFDTGQDGTQTSANGVDPNPVARWGFNDPSVYYLRETGPLSSGSYTVSGFLPFFWISHEAVDDFIPATPAGQPPQDGWLTRYTAQNPNDPVFYQPGVPIFFRPTQNHNAGIIMVGDTLTPGTPVHIREGRVAFKTRIQMGQDVASNGIAGIVYKKSLTDPTRDGIFNAPGYMLLVNQAGGIQLLGPDGLLWDGGINTNVLATIHNQGTLLEVRTHNGIPGYQEIYVNNILTAIITTPDHQVNDNPNYDVVIDENHFSGPGIGYFATTTAGDIRFSHREIYDVSTEVEITYEATEMFPGLKSEFIIRNAPFVTSNFSLYRFNHVFFAANDPDLAHVWRRDQRFELLSEGPNPSCIFTGILGSTWNNANDPEVEYLWTGDGTGEFGVFCRPLEALIDGVPSTQPHALLARGGETACNFAPVSILHLNSLPVSANQNPLSIQSSTLKALWSPVDLRLFPLPTIAPETMTISRGVLVSGSNSNLEASDNSDLTIRRNTTSTGAVVQLIVESTSPVQSPAIFRIEHESAVFARSQIVEKIELFNFSNNSWTEVSSRNSRRFQDSTTTYTVPGEATEFVEVGTKKIRARVTYESTVRRQSFSANVDMIRWLIGS